MMMIRMMMVTMLRDEDYDDGDGALNDINDDG